MSNPNPPLSSAGQARMDQIGVTAAYAARSRRARRRFARSTAVAAAVMAMIVFAIKPHPAPTGTQVARVLSTHPRPPALPGPPTEPVPSRGTIEFVRTDPTIVDRLRVGPNAPRHWVSIGDRELLDALAAAGRPAGLIRTVDRVVLVEP